MYISCVVACDHRACISLGWVGRRWLEERFNVKNTIPKFKSGLTRITQSQSFKCGQTAIQWLLMLMLSHVLAPSA